MDSVLEIVYLLQLFELGPQHQWQFKILSYSLSQILPSSVI